MNIDKIKEKITYFLKIKYFFIFVSYFLIFSLLYFKNSGISSIDDHFFHFKYAYLIRTQGWDVVENFKWISIAGGNSGQYQLSIYNLFLIPFTFAKDLIFGLKIVDIFLAASSLTLIYYVFSKNKIKFVYLWMMVLMSVGFFMHRQIMGRAMVLVPAFLLLELYFANEKKYKKLFLISAFHVAWHPSTFFLPFVVAIISESSRILAKQSMYWKNIITAALSFILGINLSLFKISSLFAGIFSVQMFANKNGEEVAKIQGSELYTFDIFKILGISNILLSLVFIAFFVIFFLYLHNRKEKKALDNSYVVLYSAFLLNLMGLAGSILASGRFIDYYFPSTIFLFAYLVSWLGKNGRIKIDKNILKYSIFGISSFFIFFLSAVLIDKRQIISVTDHKHIGKVANWISDKSKKEERIYLSNWSFFPVAFFYNSKNIYTMGIEPKSALDARPDLYWKWYNIFVNGIYCERQADCGNERKSLESKMEAVNQNENQEIEKENSRKIIESMKNDFNVKYVIADNRLVNILKLNPELVEDSVEEKSEENGGVINGLELK